MREVKRNPTTTCCFSFRPPARNKFLKMIIPFSVWNNLKNFKYSNFFNKINYKKPSDPVVINISMPQQNIKIWRPNLTVIFKRFRVAFKILYHVFLNDWCSIWWNDFKMIEKSSWSHKSCYCSCNFWNYIISFFSFVNTFWKWIWSNLHREEGWIKIYIFLICLKYHSVLSRVAEDMDVADVRIYLIRNKFTCYHLFFKISFITLVN